MSKSRPYIGKDGNHYSDYFTKVAADNRYEQQERLIEEQRKANKLQQEQNERIKNNGYTDNEMYAREMNQYIQSGGRIAPFLSLFCLLIGIILICSPLSTSVGIYTLSTGLIVEAISAFIYNSKNKVCHFFEISLLIISIFLFLVPMIPLNVLKNYLPIEKHTYTITNSNHTQNSTDKKVSSFGLDGEPPTYGDKKDLDINKSVKITVKFETFPITSKTIDFNPRQYFDQLEKESTIEQLNNLYVVNLSEILQRNGDD